MKLNMVAKKRREAYIFILPGFIYLVAICGYPLIYNLILSFKINVKTLPPVHRFLLDLTIINSCLPTRHSSWYLKIQLNLHWLAL